MHFTNKIDLQASATVPLGVSWPFIRDSFIKTITAVQLVSVLSHFTLHKVPAKCMVSVYHRR